MVTLVIRVKGTDRVVGNLLESGIHGLRHSLAPTPSSFGRFLIEHHSAAINWFIITPKPFYNLNNTNHWRTMKISTTSTSLRSAKRFWPRVPSM